MKLISKWIILGGFILLLGILGLTGLYGNKTSFNDGEVDFESEQDKAEIYLEKPEVELELVAGGDVMLSRHVGTKIRESGDYAMPFRKIANIFSQADIAFINLEAPFYNQGNYVTEGMIFKAEPEYIEGLELAGIDMVSLANNHARNQGRAGLIYTMDLLTENNIRYSGAGKNFLEAHAHQAINVKDQNVAFLSYTYSDGNNFVSSVGSEDPDVAFMQVDQMAADVKSAREKNDLVIVSMHAGIEYKSYPNQQQQEFAKAAIDNGAELVLGHHPHVVQTTEQYNGGYIIYSLGNLIFDQMWSEETREGVIARCKFLNKSIEEVEFIPVKIENYSQPRLASKDESDRILERMGLQNEVVKIL